MTCGVSIFTALQWFKYSYMLRKSKLDTSLIFVNSVRGHRDHAFDVYVSETAAALKPLRFTDKLSIQIRKVLSF